MRVIIAGSRKYTDYEHFLTCLPLIKDKVTSVVCGMAAGADSLGKRWAEENNIPVDKYPADWDQYGKSAGYIRNTEMAENADMLIAFWNGRVKNSGTKHMIDIAFKRKLPVMVILITDEE